MCAIFDVKQTNLNNFMRESAKNLKQAQKHDLPLNIKNMAIVSILTISTK